MTASCQKLRTVDSDELKLQGDQPQNASQKVKKHMAAEIPKTCREMRLNDCFPKQCRLPSQFPIQTLDGSFPRKKRRKNHELVVPSMLWENRVFPHSWGLQIQPNSIQEPARQRFTPLCDVQSSHQPSAEAKRLEFVPSRETMREFLMITCRRGCPKTLSLHNSYGYELKS